jgi:hypothetical protein
VRLDAALPLFRDQRSQIRRSGTSAWQLWLSRQLA